MSLKNHKQIFAGALIIVFLFFAFIVSGFLVIIEDNYETPCDELPTTHESQQILSAHTQEQNQVNAISFGMSIDTSRCPGKAEIVINYQTLSDRQKIKDLIGNTFFGIPYRMSNN